MFGLGTWEILMILIVALVFIGPSKLPSLARTMGKGMRDLRRAMAGFEDEVRSASTIPDPPAPRDRGDEGEAEQRVPRTEAHHANAAPELDPDEVAEMGTQSEVSDESSEADAQHV